jgi:hypothetical protein
VIAEFDGDADAKMDAMAAEIIKYREGEPVPLADLPKSRPRPAAPLGWTNSPASCGAPTPKAF